MFFSNNQSERPMSRRQMDRLLRQCETELFGADQPLTNSRLRPITTKPQTVMALTAGLAGKLGGWS